MRKPRKSVLTEKPNIVKDFFIGETYVAIADNYCRNKTSEDIEEILKRITEIYESSLIRQQNKTRLP